MKIDQPSRLTFWRFVLLITAISSVLAIWDLISLARDLNVVILTSRSWVGIIITLGIFGLAALLILALTGPHTRERILSLLEFPAQMGWTGFFLLVIATTGYTLFFTTPFARDLLSELGWVRLLIFWFFSLAGIYSLKAIKRDLAWFTALLIIVLFQTTFHLLATQFSIVTDYPFAMGWSETSRYYYPALFLSEHIFGNRLPWPILHPSLHLTLVPPYLFDAPLWFHRFWQVLLRFILIGLIAHPLISRLSIKKQTGRWLILGWMVLYLFQGPIYLHLTIPLILMLWGYSTQNDRRTWIFLIIASVWSGLSRLNWYPVPGILASVLYLLEVPYQGHNFWRYLRKPMLWFTLGVIIAFSTQRLYISLSGIPNPELFYTSLTSNLLWYRLFPNASYGIGVLPAALIASSPPWLVMSTILRRGGDFHPLRLSLIFAALLTLFIGGLVVSMKIGGGVDIHNLDAYLGILLIVTAYLVFGKYTSENGELRKSTPLDWKAALLLIAVPAWFLLGSNAGIKTYSETWTQAVLRMLQAQVDATITQNGEILFITQRHLISMGMLDNVEMVPEYEREELMEMAMGNNQKYLQIFRTDMENQRFVAIVVDPLSYRLLGKYYSFGEENNAWVRRVMKPILCNYQEYEVFSEDQIAIYTPQKGERTCPKK